jgi:RNA polymerase sigma factor (sigma-70 family)
LRSDYELLEAWGQGDNAAGSELFERHFDTLYRFFRNKVRDGVEDLLQQTLLGCVEGRARFRGEARFVTYLLQIARFQLYAHYRRTSRDPVLDFSRLSVADLGTSPSGVLMRNQEEELLLRGLRRLPAEQQVLLELSFWEELTGPEIAAVLEIPEPTVRSRLRRATERLRRELLELAAQSPTLRESAMELETWAARVRAAWRP